MRDGTTVRDLMHREFLGVSESDDLADAAELMLSEGADCLVVLRGGEAVGCLTPRNALTALLEDGQLEETTVGDVMEPPVPTIEGDEQLAVAEERLVTEGTGRLIVTVDEEAVGVITERDVLAASPMRRAPERELQREAGAEREAATSTQEVGDTAGVVTQSICEQCGALTADLDRSNGKLLCQDCLEV